MQVFITSVVVVVLVGVVAACPTVCSCRDYFHGLQVDCSGRGLDSIPKDIPDDTHTL